MLELVEGKPRDDILRLPHTKGYEEAKRILQQTYGKDIKVYKALIMELEDLRPITSIHKLQGIHEFYNQLSRAVRAFVTMKRLTTAQSMVYSLMDKLGPVWDVLVQKDDDWEEWGLEELVENLRKYVERNPLRESDDSSNKDDIPRDTHGKEIVREKRCFSETPESQGHTTSQPACTVLQWAFQPQLRKGTWHNFKTSDNY